MKYLGLFLWVFVLHVNDIASVGDSKDEGSGDEGSGDVAMDSNTTSELDLELTIEIADTTEDPIHLAEAILSEADWLPVGQMVTDIGQLYQGHSRKAADVKQDDKNPDLENLNICATTLNAFASLPNYLTKELVKIYSEGTSNIPGTLDEEKVFDMLRPQDDQGDEESASMTDADLETTVKELADDEMENRLRQNVVASMGGEIKDPVDGKMVMKIVDLARSLHAIQNSRCRNLCTSSMCMNGLGICNINTCEVKKCPIVCYDSNVNYPSLNLCIDRPNVVHGNRMYCCPYNFHPVVNVTDDTVKCYC